MTPRTALLRSILALLAAAAPARAEAQTAAVDIRAGPLASALQILARQTGAELLYDRALVRGRRSPGVRGSVTAEAALRQLLGGTDLAIRRSGSGAWLIYRRSAPPAPQAEDVEGPEILVVGARTQNFDIRRREDDVQPYQVVTGARIVEAHRDNLDQYFNSRVTANTTAVPPSLQDQGETVSEIDLRGLGPELTLVLVDGRRMPSIPADVFGFRQPDLNPIPLHAIERVETLTGTAGGIYGFGALGGVVNVVLRRDYRGADLHLTGGMSTRGDAGRLRLEGRLGFTPDGGRTDVMVYLSHSYSQPVRARQRDYAVRDRTRTAEIVPDLAYLLAQQSNIVTVRNLLGDGSLSFKPEFGGGSIGSNSTFLPVGFGGGRAELVALLTRNAGAIDISLPEGEGASDLGSYPKMTAAIVNIRHRFGSDLEAFFDAIVLRNRGRHRSHAFLNETILLFPDSPQNPFEQFVQIHFPPLPENTNLKAIFDTSRFTGGIIAGLPFHWRGTAEVTFGSTRYSQIRLRRDYSNGVDIFPPPEFNPLGNWEEFERVLAGYQFRSDFTALSYNYYREQSLRLAGPLARLGGGPAALTLLAERRRERVPAYTGRLTGISPFGPVDFTYPSAERTNRTLSFYAELRAPLFGSFAPVPLLNGLELQLAVRHDHLRAVFSSTPADPELGTEVGHSFAGTNYTLGARFFPMPWLMLRGSYATGEQPPPLDALLEREETTTFILAEDPRRDDGQIGTDGPILRRTQGFAGLKSLQAGTLSLGAVVTPYGEAGPRISLDYSVIRRSRDVFMLSDQMVIDNEDMWPERVVRAPMTEADRAAGFTAGRITMLDSRAVNGGRLRVETLDARFEWPMRALGGRLRLYGGATVQLHNVTRGLFGPGVERVGFLQEPLKWRANGGFDWTSGRTSLGANLQYFDRYRIVSPEVPQDLYQSFTRPQGSLWIPAQAYLDLYVSRRFRLGAAGWDASLDLGIVNLLDSSPPRETSEFLPGPGYSFYGDPRRRRVELALNASF